MTRAATGNTSLFAYATLSAPLAMLMLQLVVYVPQFYAAEMNIGLAAVGGVFFLARAWDALIDPLVGNLSDRTRSRFGRRKPWIIVATPLLMITTYLFAQPPAGVGLPYLLISAFAFYMALTAVQIPYMSWGAELSRTYAGRTRVGAFREGGLMVGLVVATALPLMVLADDNPSLREILRVFVTTVLILLPVTVIISCFVTPTAPFTETGKRNFFQAMGVLRKNKPLVRLLWGVFLLWLGGAMFNALVLFVVERQLQLPTSGFLWLVFAQYVVSIVLLPAAVWCGNRYGRHRVLVFGGYGFLLLLPLIFLVPPGNFAAALAVFILYGCISNVIWVMPPALVSDTVDFGMMKGAGDDSAIYMALYLFTQKIALAAGIGIALPLAAALGFDPQGAPSDDARMALNLVALILPSVIGIFGAILLYNYPINATRHAIVRRWLTRHDAKN